MSLIFMFRKISEEAFWEKGDGKCSWAIGQFDAGRGLYGGCRDLEAHTYHHRRYAHPVGGSRNLQNLNAHALVRGK